MLFYLSLTPLGDARLAFKPLADSMKTWSKKNAGPPPPSPSHHVKRDRRTERINKCQGVSAAHYDPRPDITEKVPQLWCLTWEPWNCDSADIPRNFLWMQPEFKLHHTKLNKICNDMYGFCTKKGKKIAASRLNCARGELAYYPFNEIAHDSVTLGK